MEREKRTLKRSATVEKREDGGIKRISGYAAVFNRDSGDLGFTERIAPGAFKNALKRSDVRGLKNHDSNLIFARQGVNLNIREDETGLYYEATPVDTATFRETAREIEAGLLDGQSFGFTVAKDGDEWRDLDTDSPKRTIREVDQLFDIGPVTFPAYPDTSVAFRSLEKAKEANNLQREEENEPDISDEQKNLQIDIITRTFENET